MSLNNPLQTLKSNTNGSIKREFHLKIPLILREFFKFLSKFRLEFSILCKILCKIAFIAQISR